MANMSGEWIALADGSADTATSVPFSTSQYFRCNRDRASSSLDVRPYGEQGRGCVERAYNPIGHRIWGEDEGRIETRRYLAWRGESLIYNACDCQRGARQPQGSNLKATTLLQWNALDAR